MKIGLLGCGGMGITHNLTLKALSEKLDIDVIALADVRDEFLEKAAVQWPEAKKYRSGMDLIQKEKLDLLHICLPSYLHTEHAVAAMERGMNVFIEKPVCLTREECQTLLEAKERTGVQVMVGQVVRSFDEYRYLKQVYDEKTYGELKSIVMSRIGGAANWGFEDWFQNEAKSGTVILDLHIHDLDFLRYMLGEPDSFEVKATAFDSGVVNQVVAQYQFETTFAVAEGLWDISPSLPFEARFRACFEKGTIIFEGNKDPALMVYLPDGSSFAPELSREFEKVSYSAGINVSDLGPYYTEIKYFIECLQTKREPVIATLEEGIQSVRLALLELEAAKQYIQKQ